MTQHTLSVRHRVSLRQVDPSQAVLFADENKNAGDQGDEVDLPDCLAIGFAVSRYICAQY